MNELVNPELHNRVEIIQWVEKYNNLLINMIESYKVSDYDLSIARYIQDLLPAFLLSYNRTITEELFIAFDQEKWRDNELEITIMRAYTEISSLFQNKIKLKRPQGVIFILVADNQRERLEEEHKAGFTISTSRFIIIFRAYYLQYGMAALDTDAFYHTIKHEFVHAFINAKAGYTNAVQLPKWFHEMVAISLGGGRKIHIRGQTMTRMPENYQDYYSTAKHLIKKYGEEKYYTFIRESILTGTPEAILAEMYGYHSYSELRWASLNVLEKRPEKSERTGFSSIKHFLNSVIFPQMDIFPK